MKQPFSEKRIWSFSLLFSIVVNLVLVALISIYWLSFYYFPPPEEERPIVVELMEIPAPKQPVSEAPSQEAEVAELNPLPEVEDKKAELPPQVESEIASEIQQKKEEVKIAKPPVDLPPAENIIKEASPSGAQDFNPGEEIDVPEDMTWQGVEAESTIKGKIEEAGASTRLSHLAQEGLSKVESTVGETLATGELSAPTAGVEKKSPFTKRPIAVIVENAPAARPQSGLSKADIVYEILAEGGITRFLAIFNSEPAENVGPVRSARPYFVLKAAENDAIFAHSGGSVEAFTYLEMLAVDHIDEMKNFQPFWRTQDRPPPHNLYTSVASLRQEAQRLGYNKPIRVGGFLVGDLGNPGGEKASKLEIDYAADYKVEFTYLPDKNVYQRFINGAPHIDAAAGRAIQCSTIIVQVAEHQVKDEEGRLEIRFVGEGKGWVFRDGKVAPLRWEKNDLRDKTRFYLADGEELKINPGKVWIEVVDTRTKVVF